MDWDTICCDPDKTKKPVSGAEGCVSLFMNSHHLWGLSVSS